ncbi:MAG: spondin domain-containing protein [Pseudomonadota bacterium]
MKLRNAIARSVLCAGTVLTAGMALAEDTSSIPSVVVTIENSAPSRGSFQTPFWIGFHDGQFDLYNRGEPLSAEGLIPGDAVERVAEDGIIGPLNAAFAEAQPGASQSIVFGPSGPLAPGDSASTTLNVNPELDRYFSYISMVLPSNDAFIANGNPFAHEIFDRRGRFVAKSFAVPGSAVLDAGTELNDEIAANTAFLNQAGPDIGVATDGVVEIHPGFRLDGSFPDGVLTHPVLGVADFTATNYRAATVSFRFVDLGKRNKFRIRLNPRQEVSSTLVDSRGSGTATAVSDGVDSVSIEGLFRRLSSDVVAAHLHLGAAGTNGPVVADLSAFVSNHGISAAVYASNVTGPLADSPAPMLALLNEMAAGNVYLNIHTANNPAGEIRGQLRLR